MHGDLTSVHELDRLRRLQLHDTDDLHRDPNVLEDYGLVDEDDENQKAAYVGRDRLPDDDSATAARETAELRAE